MFYDQGQLHLYFFKVKVESILPVVVQSSVQSHSAVTGEYGELQHTHHSHHCCHQHHQHHQPT